jgi:hypothetical protein
MIDIMLEWKLNDLLFYFEMVLYFIIMRTFGKCGKNVVKMW